jgi:hypothetical protein
MDLIDGAAEAFYKWLTIGGGTIKVIRGSLPMNKDSRQRVYVYF